MKRGQLQAVKSLKSGFKTHLLRETGTGESVCIVCVVSGNMSVKRWSACSLTWVLVVW